MVRPIQLWHQLRSSLLQPTVDEAQVAASLQAARQRLPPPLFWLIGKTQSGKTSLIRALTGESQAAIGDGFRPCTRTSRVYSFPGEEDCLLQFLDTRGLGEAGYDPTEDLKLWEGRTRLLIVVVKAMDHALAPVLGPLEQVRRAHPQWPLIVVQTSLHEGYPPGTRQHVVPYPYREPNWITLVPPDLARSLEAQRASFRGDGVRFVPVDFTLPEDGFGTEQFYGLEALWWAIEETLPWGLRRMLQEEPGARQFLRDAFARSARPHVVGYALAAGLAAAVPVPLLDIPLVLSIQGKMCHAIANIYQQPMNKRRLAEIAGSLGIGFLARLGGRELLKAIPGLGSAAAGLYAAASTYALGETLCVYFARVQQGDLPDPTLLRQIYAEQLREGRNRLEPYLNRRP